MIHGLLDQIQPCVSDDEDEQPEIDFVFSGDAARCKTLVICGAGPASAFALQAFALQPLSWSLDPEDKLSWRNEPTEASARAFPPLPKSPKFFQVPASEGVVVALLEAQVPAEYAVTWAEKLLLSVEGAQDVLPTVS
eukprot:g2158.t1